MSEHRAFPLQSIPVLVALAWCAGVAAADPPPRTFVSSAGSDLNDCSRAAPCRGFNAAIEAVAIGGEVLVLDSADYGPMTIAKPVQVVAPPGVEAGIASAFGHAVTITSSNSGRVVLSGLNITMLGPFNAIEVRGAPDLYVENSTLNGFQTGADGSPGLGRGINAVDGAVSPNLYVRDTVIRNFNYGVAVQSPFVGGIVATMSGASLHYNAVGVHIGSGVAMTIRDSVISTNRIAIDLSGNGAAFPAVLVLEQSTLTSNRNGLVLTGAVEGATARAVLAGNTIAGNEFYGVWLNGVASMPTLLSRGDNAIVDNATADVQNAGGTITTFASF